VDLQQHELLLASSFPGCCFPASSSSFGKIESQNHKLEKTSKIIKSNHQPNTTMPAKPYPEVPHLHVFLTPPGLVTPPNRFSSSSDNHNFKPKCCWHGKKKAQDPTVLLVSAFLLTICSAFCCYTAPGTVMP